MICKIQISFLNLIQLEKHIEDERNHYSCIQCRFDVAWFSIRKNRFVHSTNEKLNASTTFHKNWKKNNTKQYVPDGPKTEDHKDHSTSRKYNEKNEKKWKNKIHADQSWKINNMKYFFFSFWTNERKKITHQNSEIKLTPRNCLNTNHRQNHYKKWFSKFWMQKFVN